MRSKLLGTLVITLALCAQEPVPTGGGRGGRGGRGGAAATREFLGLGPAPDEAAAKKGEPLYQQNCAGCHGTNARGAQAPNLVRSNVVLHDEKGEEIGPLLKKGRPQAGMPAYPNMSDPDVYNIAQFLHLQVELAANRGTYGATYGAARNQPMGDPAKGKAYFEGTGRCVSCHSVDRDLAGIGKKYPQAATLQSRLLWPTTPGPVKARITLPDAAESIPVTIRKLTDFEVSFTDAAGNYHYARRDQVKIVFEDKLTGHRSLLPQYTDDDIHNLTAYLVTLK